MTNRRDFLKKAGVATAAAAGATTLAAPAVHAQSPIKWRLQTYAGPALAEHVIKPAIDSFNKIAGDQPTSWCRRVSCSGPCSAVRSTPSSPMTIRWRHPPR
jgi:hypothetical protein